MFWLLGDFFFSDIFSFYHSIHLATAELQQYFECHEESIQNFHPHRDEDVEKIFLNRMLWAGGALRIGVLAKPGVSNNDDREAGA